MPHTCLDLLVASSTRLFVASISGWRQATPNENKLILTNVAIEGDKQIVVEPLATFVAKGEQVSFYRADNKELIGVAITALSAEVGATVIFVDDLDFYAIPGDYGLYFGLNEIFGVETGNSQGSTQLNSVTLMNSGGWVSKSASLSEWNFQLTGYVASRDNAGYRLIKRAFFERSALYIERHLSNGEVSAGRVVASSFSDQVQSAAYVQYSVTFEGTNAQSFKDIIQRPVLPPPDSSNSNLIADYSSANNALLLAVV